ncbi:MAG: response regulator [bacterium]|nr:response regulator [bacterium]
MSLNILITDDSRTMRQIIRRGIRQSGLDTQMYEAADGKEALQVMREHKIDVLLTDLKMPVMDGFNLIRNIRADSTFGRVLITVISTETSPLYTETALAAGADSFLAKPFSAEELEEHISEVLHEHQK